MKKTAVLASLLLVVVVAANSFGGRHITRRLTRTPPKHASVAPFRRDGAPPKRITPTFVPRSSLLVRGGSSSPVEEYDSGFSEESYSSYAEGESEDDDDDDEERYSRQFYTLGARAHGLVRSATVLLDGPSRSGLTYECGKNLALSGVGIIVIITDDDDGGEGGGSAGKRHGAYHDPSLDDLGVAYRNAAEAEVGEDIGNDGDGDDDETVELAAEFFRRLNPSVKVSAMTRSQFLEACGGGSEDAGRPLGTNPVYLCVDRPQSTQLLVNEACRSYRGSDERGGALPFVSVETAGVYARAFCDFGPDFEVVDEDGETPRDTPLDHVAVDEDGDGDTFVVHCIEDERHDVSRGDRIVFQIGGLDADNDGGTSSATDSGAGQCEVLNVKSPTRFTVKRRHSHGLSAEEFVDTVNESSNSFARVKVPRRVPFLSLSDALSKWTDPSADLFAASDLDKSFDLNRRLAVMTSFAALDEFVAGHGRLPLVSPHDDADVVHFCRLARHTRPGDDDDAVEDDWTDIVDAFARCCRARLAPVQALLGALGAQEALKAASGLYNPVKQFLLYDCDELLAHRDRNAGAEVGKDGRAEPPPPRRGGAAGQSYVLGESLTRKLASAKLFVVGSGAIGCEVLKNLSAMGAGTRKKKGGVVVLTDMDTIERSNLSRQLLFRDADVGKFKSAAAREAARRYNPRMNVDAHTSKVGDDVSDGPFDDDFWAGGVDVVLNALDNIEARLYMDGQCVAHRKGLIDAGTLGSKGNVQVVVPGKSESYGSSVDPPEPAIPVCTLKNFPYDISHTIQWGRDLFDGLFNRRPNQVNDNAEALSSQPVEDFARKLLHNLGEDAALEAAEEMGEDFMADPEGGDDDPPGAFVDRLRVKSIEWAVRLAHRLFYKAVVDLLRQHPPDSLDDEGEPFWSGTRRVPRALSYDASPSDDGTVPAERMIANDHLVEFVRSAARLRIETFLSGEMLVDDAAGRESDVSVEDAIFALEAFSPLNDDSSTGSNDEEEQKEGSVLSRVVNELNGAKEWVGQITPMNSVEFEKDDETNGHVSFVTAASNLRALCYGIKPVDAMETRRVAGRIVPAMITTTGLVSAVSCVELLKMMQGVPLRLHRNAFVNLALPFFAFTSPLPAEEVSGLRGETYTIWDRVVVKEGKKSASAGGMKLSRFLRQLSKQVRSEDDEESVEISSISYGPYMLYANFLHEGDESILRKSIWDLIKDAVISGDDIDEDEFFPPESDDEEQPEKELTNEQREQIKGIDRKASLELSVIAEDPETGEEVELPPVVILRWKDSES